MTKRKPGGDERMGLSDAIKARCAELGLSKARASQELGLQENGLARWSGPRPNEPNADAIELLMEFLGVDLDELGGMILVDKLRKDNYRVP